VGKALERQDQAHFFAEGGMSELMQFHSASGGVGGGSERNGKRSVVAAPPAAE
jgi:hypothetical protein